MKDKEASPIVDLAEQAMKAYDQAFRAGLRLHEEAGRWWSGVLQQAASTHDWRKQFTGLVGVANEATPAAQRGMEELLEWAENNAKTGAELFCKAVDAASSARIGDKQAKWMDFWTSSWAVTQANAQAVARLNSHALDAWLAFVEKTTSPERSQASKTS